MPTRSRGRERRAGALVVKDVCIHQRPGGGGVQRETKQFESKQDRARCGPLTALTPPPFDACTGSENP